jgi:Icc-related predicted phosphoesterase
MRALVIADDDDVLKQPVPGKCDVLIACGDLADATILAVAERASCQRILAVKGNHDSGAPFPTSITDLHLNVVEIGGLRFGGFNGSWKYKPRGHYLYEQDEVERMLRDFPPVDVFVAHNSPRLIHDRADDVHIGFAAFNSYLERARPRLMLHGHQHVNRETAQGATKIMGVFGLKPIMDF